MRRLRLSRSSLPVRGLIALVRLWQLSFSAVMPPSCRFQPSCSAYAVEALATHGVVRGLWLTLRRLVRCHPWGGMGFDPVPPKKY